MTAAPTTVRYSYNGQGVATVVFDRDEKRNAFDNQMSAAVLRSLERAEEDHARVVVIRANPGVKVWCAGHDLSELDPEALDAEHPTLKVFDKIQSTPLPVIAMVEGSVYAAGMLIALCADIVVAAENAEIAITANKMGLPLAPELYAFWLRVMGIHKTKELLFTASTISAADAYHAGLYNHVVAFEELEQITQAIAAKIIACAPQGVANAKRQLNLLARQTSLTDEDRAAILRENSRLLDSPETRARITALLASLRE